MFLKKYWTLLLVGSLALTSACRSESPSDPDDNNTTAKADEINNFVYKAMNSWYYWQREVPDLADNRFKTQADYVSFINGKTPDKLFYSLLKSTDGFSWIENTNDIVRDARVAEIEKKSGFDYALYPKGGGSTNYVALVNYVVPNSPAANAGLKRGDVITKVNGAYLTDNNFGNLDKDQFTVTRAETVKVDIVNNYYQLTTTDKNESLSVSKADIDENPIAFYKKFDLAGKKIGYLVFNAFSIDYNDELNAQFAQMKSDGITDLVLDLRYNGGGSLSTALALAQMINGNFTGQDYLYSEYNSKHTSYNGYDKLSSTIPIYKVTDGHPEKTGTQPANSLSLPKIYVLVSFQTASASELTVYCLSKFINITTVGYYTVGKFVGSQTLYDSPNDDWTSYEKRNKSHNWKIQPITFAYYNKNKDAHPTAPFNGVKEETITPDYRISPYQAFNNIKEFGETTDPELNKALTLITGLTTLRKAETTAPFLDYDLKIVAPKNRQARLTIEDFDSYLRNRSK